MNRLIGAAMQWNIAKTLNLEVPPGMNPLSVPIPGQEFGPKAGTWWGKSANELSKIASPIISTLVNFVGVPLAEGKAHSGPAFQLAVKKLNAQYKDVTLPTMGEKSPWPIIRQAWTATDEEIGNEELVWGGVNVPAFFGFTPRWRKSEQKDAGRVATSSDKAREVAEAINSLNGDLALTNDMRRANGLAPYDVDDWGRATTKQGKTTFQKAIDGLVFSENSLEEWKSVENSRRIAMREIEEDYGRESPVWHRARGQYSLWLATQKEAIEKRVLELRMRKEDPARIAKLKDRLLEVERSIREFNAEQVEMGRPTLEVKRVRPQRPGRPDRHVMMIGQVLRQLPRDMPPDQKIKFLERWVAAMKPGERKEDIEAVIRSMRERGDVNNFLENFNRPARVEQ